MKKKRRRDPARVLPPEIQVDASRRETDGIRISLPGRGGTPLTPKALRAALEKIKRPLMRVRERPHTRYGAGWAGPPHLARPGDDALRTLDYVVVDVETTGGACERGHRITEVLDVPEGTAKSRLRRAAATSSRAGSSSGPTSDSA